MANNPNVPFGGGILPASSNVPFGGGILATQQVSQPTAQPNTPSGASDVETPSGGSKTDTLWRSLKTAAASDVNTAKEYLGGVSSLLSGGAVGSDMLASALQKKQQYEQEAEEEAKTANSQGTLTSALALAARNPLTTLGLALAVLPALSVSAPGAGALSLASFAAKGVAVPRAIASLGVAMGLGTVGAMAGSKAASIIAPISLDDQGVLIPTKDNYRNAFVNDLAGAVGGVVIGGIGFKKAVGGAEIEPGALAATEPMNNPMTKVAQHLNMLTDSEGKNFNINPATILEGTNYETAMGKAIDFYKQNPSDSNKQVLLNLADGEQFPHIQHDGKLVAALTDAFGMSKTPDGNYRPMGLQDLQTIMTKDFTNTLLAKRGVVDDNGNLTFSQADMDKYGMLINPPQEGFQNNIFRAQVADGINDADIYRPAASSWAKSDASAQIDPLDRMGIQNSNPSVATNNETKFSVLQNEVLKENPDTFSATSAAADLANTQAEKLKATIAENTQKQQALEQEYQQTLDIGHKELSLATQGSEEAVLSAAKAAAARTSELNVANPTNQLAQEQAKLVTTSSNTVGDMFNALERKASEDIVATKGDLQEASRHINIDDGSGVPIDKNSYDMNVSDWADTGKLQENPVKFKAVQDTNTDLRNLIGDTVEPLSDIKAEGSGTQAKGSSGTLLVNEAFRMMDAYLRQFSEKEGGKPFVTENDASIKTTAGTSIGPESKIKLLPQFVFREALKRLEKGVDKMKAEGDNRYQQFSNTIDSLRSIKRDYLTRMTDLPQVVDATHNAWNVISNAKRSLRDVLLGSGVSWEQGRKVADTEELANGMRKAFNQDMTSAHTAISTMDENNQAVAEAMQKLINANDAHIVTPTNKGFTTNADLADQVSEIYAKQMEKGLLSKKQWEQTLEKRGETSWSYKNRANGSEFVKHINGVADNIGKKYIPDVLEQRITSQAENKLPGSVLPPAQVGKLVERSKLNGEVSALTSTQRAGIKDIFFNTGVNNEVTALPIKQVFNNIMSASSEQQKRVSAYLNSPANASIKSELMPHLDNLYSDHVYSQIKKIDPANINEARDKALKMAQQRAQLFGATTEHPVLSAILRATERDASGQLPVVNMKAYDVAAANKISNDRLGSVLDQLGKIEQTKVEQAEAEGALKTHEAAVKQAAKAASKQGGQPKVSEKEKPIAYSTAQIQKIGLNLLSGKSIDNLVQKKDLTVLGDALGSFYSSRKDYYNALASMAQVIHAKPELSSQMGVANQLVNIGSKMIKGAMPSFLVKGGSKSSNAIAEVNHLGGGVDNPYMATARTLQNKKVYEAYKGELQDRAKQNKSKSRQTIQQIQQYLARLAYAHSHSNF